MAEERVITASEMEQMSPDDRARIVREHELSSLDGLDPDFRTRVEAKSRRIVEEHGLLDVDPS